MGLWEVEDWGAVADRACWAMFAVTSFPRVEAGLDDYITLFCLAVFLATCILITLGSQYGLGKIIATVPPENVVPALKYNVIISSVLIWTFSLPKFAIISTLERILSPGIKTTVLFWGLAISSQACILATSIWWYKQCDPVEYGWDRSVSDSTCAIMADLGYFTSAYSAFLDVFFAFYPIPFIMRLNMPLKTRIAVATALGLSALAFVVSIYKLAIFGEIFEILATDFTYPVPYLDILGVAEGCILMVCASLPTLGPLYRYAKTKITTYGDSRGTRQITSSSGNNHFESHHSQSTAARGFKGGRKFDSDAEGQEPSLHLRPSFDAIPLVSSDKNTHPFDRNDLEVGGIQRTMEVSVSSHSLSGIRSQERAGGF
ncbi:hypothetical protein QBC40DRAFT_318126 [Triangularia verruculosa]|uniref:Rhodopsin domain-containing protein n=1 Tax=Triangularia verruculosa TaxID=2587418 RepID=A0AAN6X8P2_9PEZI|nr:hypothetical protein QBC40DRAFT_318126 [Triangularia verruculosa]